MAFNSLERDNVGVFLHLIGCGPMDNYFKSLAGKSVFFHGLLRYEDALSLCKSADFLVNPPIKSAALQSVTNKLSDYIALGKPILNSQLNLEVLEILQSIPHINFNAGDPFSVYASVKDLICARYCSSNYAYPEKFDRAISYSKLKKFVETL